MKALDPNGVLLRHGEDELRRRFDAARPFNGEEGSSDEQASRLSFTLFRDIDPAPRKEWLVKDFLGAGEISCMFGPPGSCKSTLAGDMAGHVAAGMEWLGRRVKKSGVLYVAAERAGLVKRRMAAFRKHHGLDNIPLAIVSGPADLRTSQDDADMILAYVNRLTALCKVKVGLIIMETVSRLLAGGDENSSKDMGVLVRVLSRIQEESEAHVLTVHHTPVDGSHRLRGHGCLLGAFDTTIGVEKLGQAGQATVDKVNDGPEGEKVSFRLVSVDLSHDAATGVTTTAPIVVASDAPARAPPLKGRSSTTLRLLEMALDDAPASPPASNYIPRTARTTTLTEFRRRFDLGTVVESDKPDTKRKAFVRECKKLQDLGIIGVWRDFVWKTDKPDKAGQRP
jgi:hypothetical protein